MNFNFVNRKNNKMVVSDYITFTNSYRDELWEKHNSFAIKRKDVQFCARTHLYTICWNTSRI